VSKLKEFTDTDAAVKPPSLKTVNLVRISVVRERSVKYDSAITSSKTAADLFRTFMSDLDREVIAVVMLDTKNKPIGINVVSVGILDSTIVHPREVFKPAILMGAAAIILCHNHPSGDPEPSHADKRVTERIAEAGRLLGIELLDHIILGDDRHTSLKERGAL
jgi:DNA repair protein RadC